MPNTPFNGSYNAYTQSGLTQTINRTAGIQALSGISLTPSANNYSKVFTLTCTINSSAPNTLSVGSYVTNGIPITQVSPTVYTVSSQYTLQNGVTVNNWPYFQLLLKKLCVTTYGSTWPNPAFTIGMSLTDGTTTSTGTLSLSQLDAATPITAVLSGSRINVSSATLTWTASTQTIGSGIVGYYVFKDGSTTALANVTGGALTYTDTTLSQFAGYYTVQAYDGSGPPTVSALSNIVNIPAATITAPTVTISRTSLTTCGLSWGASTTNYGSPSITYQIFVDGALTPITTTTGFSYSDTSLTSSTVRSYTVKAVDTANPGIGSALSNTVNITVASITTPSVVLVRTLRTSLDLSWGASTTNYGSPSITYQIFVDGNITPIATISGLTYTDSSITASTVRTYDVRAVDAAGSVFSGNGSANIVSLAKFVVLNNTSSLYSSDGISWTVGAANSIPAIMGATPYYGAVEFNGPEPTPNAWVYSASDVLSTSQDGVTWTNITNPSTGVKYLDGVISNGSNIFVANNLNHNSGIYSSDSGATWSTFTLPGSSIYATGYYLAVKYGNGKFIITTSTGSDCFYSTDGSSWTRCTTWPSLTIPEEPEDPYLSSHFIDKSGILYANGKWIILTRGTQGYTSTDGISWSTISTPTHASSGSSTVSNYSNLTYGNSTWVALGGWTGVTTVSSTDGVTWTPHLVSSGYSYGNLLYNLGKFIYVGRNNTVGYSTDGVTWSSVTPSTLSGLADGPKFVASNGTYFVCSGKDNATGYVKLFYSTDAVNWTAITMPADIAFIHSSPPNFG